jgi:general secretion pathway protein N
MMCLPRSPPGDYRRFSKRDHSKKSKGTANPHIGWKGASTPIGNNVESVGVAKFLGSGSFARIARPWDPNGRDLIRSLMKPGVTARLGWLVRFASPAGWEKMVAWFKIIGLSLLSGLILTAGRVPASLAATLATLDILPNDVAGVPERVEVGHLKPLVGQKRDAAKLVMSGNPLWSVPLSVLTATQERPIFSASRRPPPRVVAGPPIQAVIVPVAKPAEPERPALALIGAVVGDSAAIAVFLDRTNQKIVRLRSGDTHAGWVLSSVQGREVTLKKAEQTEVLVLQRQDGPGSPGIPGIAGLPPPMPAAAGGVESSYTPFVPRSTPKNGQSDGL